MTSLAWIAVAVAVYAVATLLLASSLYALGRTGVPVKHTPAGVAARALELAELQEGDLFFDPGCGDGRLLREARRRFGARCVGCELSAPLWLWAQVLRLCDRGRGGVRIRFGEGLARVPDGVDAVYCYLMPRPMERVRNELAPRLKTGARIVSYLFPVRAWEPERVVEVGELHEPLYLYRMPPRPAAVPPPTVAAAAVAPPSAERHVDEGPSRLPDIVPGSPALPPAAPPEGGTTNGDVGLR